MPSDKKSGSGVKPRTPSDEIRLLIRYRRALEAIHKAKKASPDRLREIALVAMMKKLRAR